MKLPSIQYLSSQAEKAFLRFPLSIVSSFIAVVIAVYAFEFKNEINNPVAFINVILIAALGIPTFFCATVLIENRSYTARQKSLTYLIPFIVLGLIYMSLPNSELSDNFSVPYIRYTVYNIIIHLLVSFIPYWNKGNLNAFWNYNKLLFLRILTSLLYSVFLYAGLALALTALDVLFDIELHYELFMDLLIVIFGFFNTWFFVAGIPSDFNQLESDTNYPKGLKIFTQYVLLPILGLYLIILYSYGGKIVVEWSLPKGIVSYLISGVSTLGIFTFLLIYPYGKLKETKWIKKFTLGYYYLLIPLIALLFIAIVIRLQAYGFTIKRYIVLLLGIWLVINSIYFIIRKKNIKFIPISLAIIMGLMSFGPWGMFSLSESSQHNRLVEILTANNLLVDGKMVNEVIWEEDSLPKFHSSKKFKNDSLLTDSLHNEVYSIIEYLDDFHTYELLTPYFEQDITSLIQEARDSNRWVYPEKIIMETMGLTHMYRWNYKEDDDFINKTIESDGTRVKRVTGYDYVSFFNRQFISTNNEELSFLMGKDYLTLGFVDTLKNKIYVRYDKDTVKFDFMGLVERLDVKNNRSFNFDFPKKDLTLIQETEDYKFKIEIDRMGLRVKNDSMYFNYVNGNIYLKLKNEKGL